MIGNDVVDLRDPETRPGAHHPRFDGRVFAPSERDLLERSGAPNRLRWMLWAAKEAAYKVARKIDPRTVFSPARFVVELDETLRGFVQYAGAKLPLLLREDATTVHAIASDRSLDEEHLVFAVEEVSAIGETEASASRAARALAIDHLAPRLGTAARQLEIRRENRVPHLFVAGAEAPVDLSLSHHGELVAFACEVPHALAEERTFA